MVVERRNFQRVYDLTHRVMPHWDDERDLVSQTEAEIAMLDNSALLGNIPRTVAGGLLSFETSCTVGWRDLCAEQQQIIPINVERLGQLWLHADLLPLLETARGETNRDA